MQHAGKVRIRMTIADDNKFCNSCKKVGLQRKAHRIMPGEGGAQCDEHFRDISGLPQLNEEAKRFIAQCTETLVNPAAGVPHPPGSAAPAPKGVRKRLDFAAMQKDRDAGMKIAEVAKKYDCSYASVSTNTKQRTDPIPAITISGLP